MAQVFVGGEGETRSVHNLTRLVDMGNSAGIATLAVTAVGRELVRDAKYLGLATRIWLSAGDDKLNACVATKIAGAVFPSTTRGSTLVLPAAPAT